MLIQSSTAIPAWRHGLAEDYKLVLVEQWSPYTGAILLVLLNLALMAVGEFWGVFGGVRLWGDWLNTLIGLGPLLGLPAELDGPLDHRISLSNVALFLGALAAALLSRQFRVNRAPPQEYAWAAIGGILMGIGALFAGGCTTGGFFTPLLFSSASGWMMLVGLVAGAAIGLKILLWGMETFTWGMSAPAPSGEPMGRRFHPLIGLGLLVAVLVWASSWALSGDERLTIRAVIVAIGFALGFVLHRSRFCMSRVVREPVMTGEGEITKACMLAVAIGVPIASLLIQKGMVDPYLPIPARFWLGSLVGGVIFGIGMIFAGGCAAGSLWRMGEGHLKLWVAMIFFAWSASTFGALIGKTGILASEMNLDLIEEGPLGFEAFLPAMTGGWPGAYAVTFALLALWYGLVRYNESTGRFTVG